MRSWRTAEGIQYGHGWLVSLPGKKLGVRSTLANDDTEAIEIAPISSELRHAVGSLPGYWALREIAIASHSADSQDGILRPVCIAWVQEGVLWASLRHMLTQVWARSLQIEDSPCPADESSYFEAARGQAAGKMDPTGLREGQVYGFRYSDSEKCIPAGLREVHSQQPSGMACDRLIGGCTFRRIPTGGMRRRDYKTILDIQDGPRMPVMDAEFDALIGDRLWWPIGGDGISGMPTGIAWCSLVAQTDAGPYVSRVHAFIQVSSMSESTAIIVASPSSVTTIHDA